MESEPEGDIDPAMPDEFDSVLNALARPPEVGQALLERVTLPSTIDMPQPPFGTPQAVEQGPSIGAILDERYCLQRVLGRGGMGVVYAARNLRTGKIVAIKWMAVGNRNGLTQNSIMAERFRREARAAASIRHPNVVDVYDVGGDDSSPFLVMELLEGEPLSARIARGILPFDEAARVLLGVMRGVAAAHRAGIVHRDLKPDNVFLCRDPDGSSAVPKVLDFGVAAIRGDSADGLASLTRSGAIIGTPAYMSPEQLIGKPVDLRTDIYALGLILFETLTGRLPFQARNAGELAVMQATHAPTSVLALRPDIPKDCERLVVRALARDADSRFASVDEFAAELERVVSEPIILRAVASRRRSTTLLAVVALGTSLSIGWYAATRSRAPLPATAKSYSEGALPVQRLEKIAKPKPIPEVTVALPPAKEGPLSPGESEPVPPPQPTPRQPRRVKRPTLKSLATEPSEPASRPKTSLRYEDF